MIIIVDENSFTGNFVAFKVNIPEKLKKIKLDEEYYPEETFKEFMDETFENGIGFSKKEAIEDFLNKNIL